MYLAVNEDEKKMSERGEVEMERYVELPERNAEADHAGDDKAEEVP